MIGVRTFDIISKYISDDSKCKVFFDVENGPAYASMDKREIHMPKNIKEDDLMIAMSTLMHEAGHLKLSDIIPAKEIVRDEIDKAIINVCEDVRVDANIMAILPGIRDFYEKHAIELLDKLKKSGAWTSKDYPFIQKVFVATILSMEDFHGLLPPPKEMGKDVHDKMMEIRQHACYVIDAINHQNKGQIMMYVDHIRKALDVPYEPNKPKPQPQPGGNAEGEETEGLGLGVQGEDEEGQKEIPGGISDAEDEGEDEGQGKVAEKAEEIVKAIEEVHPSNSFGPGDVELGKSSAAEDTLGGVAYQEQTKKLFKEFLKLKEIRRNEGENILDTDELVSFFTGDISTLFKQEVELKNVKSKIVFLLDASGSMCEVPVRIDANNMCDGKNTRYGLLVKTMRGISDILEEVKIEEGVGIGWEIHAFHDYFAPLRQESWDTEYVNITKRGTGGTDIALGFDAALNVIKKDQEATGKKIVIVITDGYVDRRAVEYIRQKCVENNGDVRCVFIGIGADLFGHMTQQIFGNRVIYTPEQADQVVMETITECIE